MGIALLRIGIAGCGHAARVHLERLLALEQVRVVGCADKDLALASELIARVPARVGESEPAARAFSDHRALLEELAPDALAIFTPHMGHYRPAMDGLQAGCHLFVEKPLSTNLQEAVDIVSLARGRNRKVAVGHQFRLRPSLREARRRIAEGTIGPVRLVTAILAQSWLAAHGGTENSWRFDPKVSGGGILADAGDHLVDALLWTSGQVAIEVAAVQSRLETGLDVVTAAALRLADGTPATLAISGITSGTVFELDFHGDRGRLRVTDQTLEEETEDTPWRVVSLSGARESIDADFVSALLTGTNLCCPAEEALDTVRLLEAMARSAASGQIVRLS
jgi:predicted dehydrogenase